MSIVRTISAWAVAFLLLVVTLRVAGGLMSGVHQFRELTRDMLLNVTREVIMAAGTILGVVSRGLYDAIERQRSSRVRFGTILRSASTSRSFWMAVILSPILLVGFHASLAEISNLLLIGVLSYQNGFFFRSVVKQGDKEDAPAVGTKNDTDVRKRKKK